MFFPLIETACTYVLALSVFLWPYYHRHPKHDLQNHESSMPVANQLSFTLACVPYDEYSRNCNVENIESTSCNLLLKSKPDLNFAKRRQL